MSTLTDYDSAKRLKDHSSLFEITNEEGKVGIFDSTKTKEVVPVEFSTIEKMSSEELWLVTEFQGEKKGIYNSSSQKFLVPIRGTEVILNEELALLLTQEGNSYAQYYPIPYRVEVYLLQKAKLYTHDKTAPEDENLAGATIVVLPNSLVTTKELGVSENWYKGYQYINGTIIIFEDSHTKCLGCRNDKSNPRLTVIDTQTDKIVCQLGRKP